MPNVSKNVVANDEDYINPSYEDIAETCSDEKKD